METYKLKFTKLQMEIFRLLCIKTGERINQNKTAKLLKVSPTAIAKSLPKLEKDGLITVERSKEMNLISITLNRENQRSIQLKRAENLKMLYETGFPEFIEEKHAGSTISLFGSYSKGEDTIRSDIDIAVIGSKAKQIEIKKFEKMLERDIRVNYYASFKDINKELKENILNGIVLSGGIEL